MFMSTNQTQCVYVIWHYGHAGSLEQAGGARPKVRGLWVMKRCRKMERRTLEEKNESDFVVGFDNVDRGGSQKRDVLSSQGDY